MFPDVPECSGMFRNVPCSWFYRRPEISRRSHAATAKKCTNKRDIRAKVFLFADLNLLIFAVLVSIAVVVS